MREGDVVMVVGELDERVRPSSGEAVYGTIVHLTKDEVEVLLNDGNIWRGLKREVVPQNEQ